MQTINLKYRDNFFVIAAEFISQFGTLIKMHLEDG
jgi:hypothetical protein